MGSLGHPSKFQQVSRLSFLTPLTSLNRGQPNFARCLAVSWAGTLYIHFRGFLPPNRILRGAKFTLCSSSSLVFSYVGSVTAQHSSSRHQPNFAAFSRGCHLYSAGRPSCWALACNPVTTFSQTFSEFDFRHAAATVLLYLFSDRMQQEPVHCRVQNCSML